MPRKPASHADKARRAFLRGTTHTSPHAAIETGARSNRRWLALLDGQQVRFHMDNGLKARRAVKARHPMRSPEAE